MNDERDATIQRLTTAFADGTLPMEEFERRVELANRTEATAALRAIVADLPALQEKPPAEARSKRTKETFLVNLGKVPTKDEVVSIFSSVQRTGHWVAPRKLDAVGLFGSSLIDLRNAKIPKDGMKIDAVGLFGSVTVIVPEGVNLHVRNVAIFGSASGGGNDIDDEDSPTIEIESVGIFGSVGVHVKPR